MLHSRDNGLRKKNKTPGGGTVRVKDFAEFKMDVDRKFKGLDRKLDELLHFLTSSSNTMGSVTPGDTASLSGASSATSSTSRTTTTINKTLKPYTRRIFQLNPFAQSQEIYLWLQDNGSNINLPMFPSDRDLADKLKR